MLWKINDSNDEIQYINGLDKNTTPAKLIIDGQQRLNTLYSVIMDSEIIGGGYKQKFIKINVCKYLKEKIYCFQRLN